MAVAAGMSVDSPQLVLIGWVYFWMTLLVLLSCSTV